MDILYSNFRIWNIFYICNITLIRGIKYILLSTFRYSIILFHGRRVILSLIRSIIDIPFGSTRVSLIFIRGPSDNN